MRVRKSKAPRPRASKKSDVVFVIADGEAAVRTVETGVSDDLSVEITGGLADGEEVIIGPYRTLKKLHAGDAVKTEEKKDDEDEGADEEGSGGVEVRVD